MKKLAKDTSRKVTEKEIPMANEKMLNPIYNYGNAKQTINE